MSIWFVTPAWRRFALTEVCLEQRRRIIEGLAHFHGIEAHCVVIADDDNLDIARAKGFSTVERDNEWLGRRFNDGIEFAARQGAEWIVPIGSDSWIDPAYLTPLPDPARTRTSRMYAPVEAHRLAELSVGGNGAGPYMLHRSILPASLRPAEDRIKRHVDGSTLAGLARPPVWEYRDLHALQYVGFRQAPLITAYTKLVRRWGVIQRRQPWRLLAGVYPPDLVDRASRIIR